MSSVIMRFTGAVSGSFRVNPIYTFIQSGFLDEEKAFCAFLYCRFATVKLQLTFGNFPLRYHKEHFYKA